MQRIRSGDFRFAISLLLPALFLLSFLIVYPLINAVNLSLHSQLIYEIEGRYVGLQNYFAVLRDPSFIRAFWNNIIWTVGTVGGQILLGVIGALLLNEVVRFKGLVRGLVLLPFLCLLFL